MRLKWRCCNVVENGCLIESRCDQCMIGRFQEAGVKMDQTLPLAFMEGKLIRELCDVASLGLDSDSASCPFAEFKKVARAKRKGKRKFAVKVCTLRATVDTTYVHHSLLNGGAACS